MLRHATLLRSWLSALVLAVLVIVGPARAADQVTPINDRDYYPAMEKLIAGARHSVEICLYEAEFYTEYPGSASNNLIDALCAAANRGVRVTAVMDRSGFRNGGEHDAQQVATATRLAQAGVSVYFDPDEIQSHQKLAIFDRDIVVVASVNWKHYSLTSNREVAVALWSQEAGRRYEQYFAERVSDGSPFVVEGARLAPLAGALEPAVLGLPTFPLNDIAFLENRWFYINAAKAIREATSEIFLVQNYAKFYPRVPRQVPGRPDGKPPETNLLLDELVAAMKRGVKVTYVADIMWNADVQREWSDTDRVFMDKLAAAGATVLRDDPNITIHAKMMVIDGDKAIVGSTNWSFEAMELNNEVSVLITSPAAVQNSYLPWVRSILEKAEPYDAPLPALGN
jgi:phosphatidylserine/phosphatidylglycerophosphate/cardiolipin synthase-like enzyme